MLKDVGSWTGRKGASKEPCRHLLVVVGAERCRAAKTLIRDFTVIQEPLEGGGGWWWGLHTVVYLLDSTEDHQ